MPGLERAVEGLAVGGELSAVPWLPDAPFQGVEFVHSDVTKEASLKYTHIYIFDWVFSKHVRLCNSNPNPNS
jgi:hypothetical protein